MVFCTEKSAAVYSLPSQRQMYTQTINESSYVVSANIGAVYVLNFLANSVSQQGFSTEFLNRVSQLGFSTFFLKKVSQQGFSRRFLHGVLIKVYQQGFSTVFLNTV